jgi:hypothetical protein
MFGGSGALPTAEMGEWWIVHNLQKSSMATVYQRGK